MTSIQAIQQSSEIAKAYLAWKTRPNNGYDPERWQKHSPTYWVESIDRRMDTFFQHHSNGVVDIEELLSIFSECGFLLAIYHDLAREYLSKMVVEESNYLSPKEILDPRNYDNWGLNK